MENRRPTSGSQNVLIHHDNTSSQTSAIIQYLKEQHVHVLPHLPYNPYLLGCYFWLFPLLKNRLAAVMFSHVQDLSKALNSELKTIPLNDYHRDFIDWLRRSLLCKGEYFLGMSQFHECMITVFVLSAF